MIKLLKHIILLLWIFYLMVQTVFSQHTSKNNYTGAWETPTSWIPTWAVPQTTNINNDITIYGLITRNGSLIFSNSYADLTVNDTLVIKGNLTIGHNDHLTVSDNGILLISGNLILDDDAIIDANGYLIVTGNIDKIGGTSHAYIRSNDNPVKVFIGGTIDAALLNKTWNPVLECTTAPSSPYPNSGCSYGNIADLINDPIYIFFQTICSATTATLSADGSTTFCTGSSVTLTSSPGIAYLWSNGATTQNINVTTSDSCSVIVINASGCQSEASAETIITVNALPITPTITAESSTTLCYGDVVTLTSSPGMYYLWSSGATTPSVDITTVGNYTVQVSNASGCTSTPSVPIEITVNSLPVTPTISADGPTTFCAEGNVILTSDAGTSYLWSNGATTRNINALLSGSYSAIVINANGCQSAASEATIVTVLALPIAPTIITGGPTTFCEGDGVMLNSSSGTSYLWSTGATTKSINITSAGNYTVQITNASGCQSAASAAALVTVNALPGTPTITADGPTTFCAGGNVTLTSTSASMYLWTTGANTESIKVSETGNYSVEVTNASGCQSVSSVLMTVVVNKKPVAKAGEDQELKFVFETQMEAELSLSEIGEWSLISGSGHITDIYSPKTMVTGLLKGENKFSWKVQNGNCEASADVKIDVYDIFVPSVITPNGDGKNDCFVLSDFIEKAELIILNRWGNTEYINSNYLNDWSGLNSKGLELPNDTYFYVLKLQNNVIKKGSVLIKR